MFAATKVAIAARGAAIYNQAVGPNVLLYYFRDVGVPLASGENLQELIEKSGSPDQARRLAAFAGHLFAHLPEDVAERMSARERFDLAHNAFDFFSVRADPIQIRIADRVTGIGDGQPVTAIESAMPDCPFIVSTVREYFHQLELPIRLLLHPILRVTRDGAGNLTSIESASAAESAESFVHLEIDLPPRQVLREILAELKRRLGIVLQVNGDFEAMTGRALRICEELAPARELIEVRDFLRWLTQESFVFLGYRRYTVREADGGRRAVAVEPDSGLGILRAEERSRFAKSARPRNAQSVVA